MQDVPDEGIDQMQECGLRRKMIADRGHVVFNEISEAYEAVKKHQEDTGTKFFKHNLTKKFGNTGIYNMHSACISLVMLKQ